MHVCSCHDYGGFGGGRDRGGGRWYACGVKPMVGRMSGDARVLPECEVIYR